MKRSEYVKLCQNGKTNHARECVVKDKSVTDPSFAQTGRQILFNPLPIEYRMKYPAGVPLDKDNPMLFKEYDKLYPDKFDAVRQANADVNTQKHVLKKVQEQTKPNKQPNQEPQN